LTQYLLDTNVLIPYSRRRLPATKVVLDILAGGDELCVCTINVAEFYSGSRVGEHPAFDYFLSTIECIPVTRADGIQAGQWRHDYARSGVQLATVDVLMAAVALRVGATLVTENVKDVPMAGLNLLDPRSR